MHGSVCCRWPALTAHCTRGWRGTEAAGRIFAKTGTLSHTSALSGYARRGNGQMLAFSILVNNYNGPAEDLRAAIDRVCTLMLQ